MRVFLGINLPISVKRNIDEQLINLKNQYPDFNWVNSGNYHITVHFIGDVEKADINKIKEKTNKALFESIQLYLYSLSLDLFFQNKVIIYLKFYREKKLEILVKNIKKSFGLYSSEKYIPHLTLARAKKSSKQQYFSLKKNLKKISIETGFPVKNIFLYETLSMGKNSYYKKLLTFKLLSSSNSEH